MVKKPQKNFVANAERLRSLENLLNSYPEVFKEPEMKGQIVRSFKFEINTALIKLYEKNTEKMTKLIEELEQFFFVGEMYFYPEPKKSRLFGAIIVSRFKDILNVAIYNAKKYKGQFEKVPDLSWILFGTPFKKISPSQERIKELKTILVRYRDNQGLFTDGYAVRDILEAFKSEELVTSIQLTNKEAQVVIAFIEDLKDFFKITRSASHLHQKIIFVSHYRNLLDTITRYSNDHEGVFERFAGLAGVLLLNSKRHPLENIAFYCFDERLKIYNFIK